MKLTSNIKPQLRLFAFDKLKYKHVASRYYDELESELQGVQVQPQSLDEKCKKLEETIQRVATNTIGYTRKQANKEWFDEKCAKARERARTKERLFVQKRSKAARRRGFYRD
jgi:hypothetical protein